MGHDPPPFTLEVHPDGERMVLKPIGELDLATVGDVRDRVRALLEDGWRRVVVDLRSVTFLDSTGVHLLVETRRVVAERDAHFAIVDGVDPVKRVLELSGLSDRFERASGV